MRDSTQFNYHLGKLTGHFITKAEGGYDFRHAGQKVVRAVLEGSFNEDPELPSFGISGACTECGAGLQAAYADEQITIDCTACGRIHSTAGLKLLDHSDVVTFHRTHGIDLCATPYWEFAWCVSDVHTTILSADPWSIRVTIPLDDEELRVTMDGNLTVTDVETFPTSTPADSRTTA